jgi:hypothetical protein
MRTKCVPNAYKMPCEYHMRTICVPYAYHMRTICLPYAYHMRTRCDAHHMRTKCIPGPNAYQMRKYFTPGAAKPLHSSPVRLLGRRAQDGSGNGSAGTADPFPRAPYPLCTGRSITPCPGTTTRSPSLHRGWQRGRWSHFIPAPVSQPTRPPTHPGPSVRVGGARGPDKPPRGGSVRPPTRPAPCAGRPVSQCAGRPVPMCASRPVPPSHVRRRQPTRSPVTLLQPDPSLRRGAPADPFPRAPADPSPCVLADLSPHHGAQRRRSG